MSKNEPQIPIDATGLFAELIQIKALLWTIAETNSTTPEKFKAFNELYGKRLDVLAKEFAANNPG